VLQPGNFISVCPNGASQYSQDLKPFQDDISNDDLPVRSAAESVPRGTLKLNPACSMWNIRFVESCVATISKPLTFQRNGCTGLLHRNTSLQFHADSHYAADISAFSKN
jgi:hypothetical protein